MNTDPLTIHEAFLEAQITGIPDLAFERMAAYVELLTRWNARLSLTAIRTSAEVVRRHLVECAFLAQWLSKDVMTLMDYGSGAGLPGMIVAVCRPEIVVTLAEAHGKKASFLRELVRTLGIKCEVFEGRVEAMPARKFDVVCMRAVEKMEVAVPIAMARAERFLLLLTTEALLKDYRVKLGNLEWMEHGKLPNSDHGILASAVPRGTTHSQ